MKKTMSLAASLAAAAATPSAHASADLAKAKACMACHTVASKLVGPSYKDVAAKYAKDAGAEARLALKIQKGSSGTWARFRCRPTRRSAMPRQRPWPNGSWRRNDGVVRVISACGADQSALTAAFSN